MSRYGVKIVGDDLMPDNVEWMFLKMKSGELQLWLAYSSAGSPRVLSEAWAAYRTLEQAPVLSTSPQQREVRQMKLA